MTYGRERWGGVPRTSSGLLLRAVLASVSGGACGWGTGVRERKVPCVCDYDVVEGLVPAAEAREADFDDHWLIYSSIKNRKMGA